MKKLLLFIDSEKTELTNIFCAYLFLYVYFCVYLACIHLRQCYLKENFAFI